MGFFSPSKSTQVSESGLRGLGNTAQQMANFLVPVVQRGSDFGEQLFRGPQSYLNKQLDPNGLYAGQNAMFPSVVNQVAANMSAGAGARGQLSPENIGSIAGSSASAIAPFLLQLMSGNIEQAQQATNDIRNFGGNLFTGAIGTGANALGTRSTTTQTGSGIGYNWADQFGENVMKWAAPGGYAKGAV